MSQGKSCRCPRTFFRVMTRKANYSAFNGYRCTPSDYSAVRCMCCGACWRTKAAWVDKATNESEAERGTTASRMRCSHKEAAA